MKKSAIVKWKLLVAFFATLVAFCIQSGCAIAFELRIRNDFDSKMFVTAVYFDASPQRWRTRGWWSVEPRSERKLSLETSKPTVYLYAELSGQSMTWGNGDITRMVIGDAFSYFDGDECPPGHRRRSVRYTEYEMKNRVLEFRPRAATADAPLKNAGDTTAQTPVSDEPLKDAGQENPSMVAAVELLNLINVERRKVGVHDLRLDETMSKAAGRRSYELKTKYSHDRPDGREYHTIFAEFDLAPRASAENIAWRSGRDRLNLAAFNKSFMDSPGHRENMLNSEYSVIGLGFSDDGEKYYVAELFAADAKVTASSPNSQNTPEKSDSEIQFNDMIILLETLGNLLGR